MEHLAIVDRRENWRATDFARLVEWLVERLCAGDHEIVDAQSEIGVET
jgi:predicted deacetylase